MIPQDLPQCMECKHFKMGLGKCDAFPKGIPDEIKSNYHDHTKPFKGDNGITFEKKIRENKSIDINKSTFKDKDKGKLLQRKKELDEGLTPSSLDN